MCYKVGIRWEVYGRGVYNMGINTDQGVHGYIGGGGENWVGRAAGWTFLYFTLLIKKMILLYMLADASGYC